MPREHLSKSREQRNEALVDAMLLAAAADGVVQNAEIRALIARVLERPEFRGTGPDQLAALVDRSVQRLTSAQALEDVTGSLRERLPDRRSRILAFALATAVALADKKAHQTELKLLKAVQAALGISEAEVAEVFECVEQGRPLSEVVGEPFEQLLADTMVLVSTADGAVHEREVRVMLESMAGDPVFHGLSLDVAQRALEEAVACLARQGLPQRLAVLANGLASHGQRLKAFELAVRVARSRERSRPEAERMLDLLQATFGLADDEVERIKKES